MVRAFNPLSNDRFETVVETGVFEMDVLANDFTAIEQDTYEGVLSTSQWATIRDQARITHVLDDDDDLVQIAPDGRSLLLNTDSVERHSLSIRYVVDAQWEQTAWVRLHHPVRDDSMQADVDGGRHVFDVLANDYYTSIFTNNRVVVADQITDVTQGSAGGTVAISDDGFVLYTPPTDFEGVDRFQYTANGKYHAEVSVNVTSPVRDDVFNVFLGPTRRWMCWRTITWTTAIIQ